ncbi:MAG: DUF3179 domain-containing protein [Candidatus Zixiibacteriota bacterium]|nr:MAG: DUF3179 domain-containing protein [candidate division Zixibacteria bacterium]
MCFTGIVYAATVDSLSLTFQASGSLWRDALVLQDMETNSLWSQVTGECISGTLEGKMLDQFPALHTTYDEFIKLYPDGLILRKPGRGYAVSSYESYFSDETKLGIFGRPDNFQRLGGKDKVIGLRLGDNQTAVSEDYLQTNGYAVIPEAKPPVVITFDSETRTAAAFLLPGTGPTGATKIRVETGRILLPGKNISWDAKTGRVVEGGGDDLKMVPAITSYWFAWISFFPSTRLIK